MQFRNQSLMKAVSYHGTTLQNVSRCLFQSESPWLMRIQQFVQEEPCNIVIQFSPHFTVGYKVNAVPYCRNNCTDIRTVIGSKIVIAPARKAAQTRKMTGFTDWATLGPPRCDVPKFRGISGRSTAILWHSCLTGLDCEGHGRWPGIYRKRNTSAKYL
jgi:hypothetical protein